MNDTIVKFWSNECRVPVMMKLTFKIPYRINIIVFTLYCFLTYIMVYVPVSIDLRETYFGQGEVVFWSNYFWWFNFSISNFLNPLWHSNIFYPMGLGMSDGIFPMLVFIPITKIFGSIVSYNIYFLSSFLFAGYGMFLLSRYLLKDEYVSFIAGIIFTFFPFHFGAGLGHLHTFSIMWIPFFVLYFIKMYEKPVIINIFLAALFLAINAYTSWTITIMVAMFSAIYILFRLRYTFSIVFFPKFVIFSMLSLLLITPGLYYMLLEVTTNKYMAKPFGDFIRYSADILAFITPSPFHPVFGRYSIEIYQKFSGNLSENIMFVGYVVILLSVPGILFFWKERFGKIVISATIIFFILSLGPVLNVGGVYKFTEHNLTAMLPGMLATKIPFLDMMRVPSRYSVMFMFGMSLISAYGFYWVLENLSITKIHKSIFKPLFTVFISFIILFEYMTVMRTQKVPETPGFYYSLQNSDDINPLLEIPINLNGTKLQRPGISEGQLMVHYYEYQKTHRKPFLGGYWSRVAFQYEDFLYSDPILSYLFSGKEDILNTHHINPLAHLKTLHNISHVILHKAFLPPKELATFISYLGNNFIEDHSVKDDPLMIYSSAEITKNTSLNVEYTTELGKGWFGIDYWGDSAVRWMSNSGELIINSRKAQSVNLNFNVYSYHKTRTLEFQLNNTLLLKQVIPPSVVKMVSLQIQLQKGKNTITLLAAEGTERPCDRPDIKTSDCRDLSFAIQNILISSD